MKVLALDFDGVICDSAEEVLQTALNAWFELFSTSDFQVENCLAEHRTTFDRLVPLGNRAEDFGVALHILHSGIAIQTQGDYDRIRKRLGPLWLDSFHHAFYRARRRLRNDDPKTWLHLHETYPAFINVLESHIHDTTLAIATAKDGDSVRLLLKHFGISRLFRDDLILDKEIGIHKTAHLQILADRIGCKPDQMTFVDDKLNHLVATAPLGVRSVLASWGHNTPREHRSAREAGFAVATLETAESVLWNS